MPYSPTVFVNDQTPALNATNLNKLRNELASQASSRGISHSLPTFTDGVTKASDAFPFQEMERVARLVASSIGLAAYEETKWYPGWDPPRNAANMNKLEAQAQTNRSALDGIVGPLTWAPPDTTGYTEITLNNTGTIAPPPYGAGWEINLPNDQDFVLHLDVRDAGVGNIQGIEINGGRNVVLIGGRIVGRLPATQTAYDVDNGHAIRLRGQRGVCHIEGVHLDGYFARGVNVDPRPGTTGGVSMNTPAGSTATYQIQNIRAMELSMWKHNFNAVHNDFFVTSAGVGAEEDFTRFTLRFDKITSACDHAGFANFEAPGHFWVPTAHYKRTNFYGTHIQCPLVENNYGAGYYYFFSRGHTWNKLDECWMETGWGYDASGDCPTQFAHNTLRQSFLLTDADNNILANDTNNTMTGSGKAQGDTITWTNPSVDHVYAADGVSPGFVTYGVPPAGDFCPASVPGEAYVSPGYL